MTSKHRKRRVVVEGILQLRVKGPGVRGGRIPVPDLIKICEEAQKTINKQAEALQGRKTQHPGPTTDIIRQECTLELVGIRKGSTRLQFGLAKPQAPLFPAESFSTEAVREVALVIRSMANGKESSREADAGVLQALYRMGAVAENKRITEIEWIAPKLPARARIVGHVNQRVRERIAVRISSPRREKMQIDGILEMADFKHDDLKCRIDPAIGASVLCSFHERDTNQVQALLRKPVRATGEAVIAPYTNRIESFQLQIIERLPSLSLGEGNFFGDSSLAHLAAVQKVRPTKDFASLRGGFPDDENIDKFLEEIYSRR